MSMTTNEKILAVVVIVYIIAIALIILHSFLRMKRRNKEEEERRRLKERTLAWEAYENQLAFSQAIREMDESTIRAFEAIIEELAKQQRNNSYTDE